MPMRERFFECIFATEQNEYRFHLREWNAQQALEHLRDDLRGCGVAVAGELRVLRAGKVLLRLPYAPVDGATENAMASRPSRAPAPGTRGPTEVEE
jgi:hypothetical protein